MSTSSCAVLKDNTLRSLHSQPPQRRHYAKIDHIDDEIRWGSIVRTDFIGVIKLSVGNLDGIKNLYSLSYI